MCQNSSEIFCLLYDLVKCFDNNRNIRNWKQNWVIALHNEIFFVSSTLVFLIARTHKEHSGHVFETKSSTTQISELAVELQNKACTCGKQSVTLLIVKKNANFGKINKYF